MGRREDAERVRKAHRVNMDFKREVASHYGGKCACCGENTIEFLQFHHGKLDGAEHRRMIAVAEGRNRWAPYLRRQGRSPKEIEEFLEGFAQFSPRPNLWVWVRDSGYPQDLGLVLLCANCHSASHSLYIKCPHKRDRYQELRDEIVSRGLGWLCAELNCSEDGLRFLYGFDSQNPSRRSLTRLLEALGRV